MTRPSRRRSEETMNERVPKAARAMALAASGDEQRIIFVQLCNVLDPGVAVAFASASTASCGS